MSGLVPGCVLYIPHIEAKILYQGFLDEVFISKLCFDLTKFSMILNKIPNRAICSQLSNCQARASVATKSTTSTICVQEVSSGYLVKTFDVAEW